MSEAITVTIDHVNVVADDPDRFASALAAVIKRSVGRGEKEPVMPEDKMDVRVSLDAQTTPAFEAAAAQLRALEAPPPKPGWKTTEAWLTFAAMVVGGFLASGLWPSDSTAMKIAGIAAFVLAGFGYNVSRGMVKAAYHAGAKVLLLGLVASRLTACGTCSQEAHRNDVVCVVINDVVDCTQESVIAVAPQFLPVVRALIDLVTGADGTVDWGSVEASLVGLGIRDGGCILAELQQQYAAAARGGPARAARKSQSFSDGLAAYRAQRWPRVKFKLPGGGTI